jgi:hypothetical protein
MTTRTFWQYHEQSGYRAKITFEWDTPDGVELRPERAAAAEEIADVAMSALGPKTLEIVLAMQGRSR